ncbi:MAG: rhodanese-like domain-containing protein [Verrucomicrobia subdivision 3 bacterium]|nr:rhodanese-like domain-containing protein [Limisphaerales bacterium]
MDVRGWISLVMVGIMCCTAAAQESRNRKQFKNIGVEEFDKLRRHTNTVVLDVRTPREFAEGHISGATNLNWNSADFEKRVAGLDKSKTYLVNCAVGGRSAKASEKLASLQLTNVYNLEGGIKAWEKAGKPVEK